MTHYLRASVYNTVSVQHTKNPNSEQGPEFSLFENISLSISELMVEWSTQLGPCNQSG